MIALSPQNQAWVNSAARGTGLPTSVVAQQINLESGFNDNAVSPTGAQGRAQFEPSTWAGLGIVGSPHDPAAALQGYVKYMGGLLKQYGGNVRNALAAYNAGPGNLQAGMGYAQKILSAAGQGSSPSGGSGGGAGGYQTVGTPIPTPDLSLTEPTFNQAGYNQAVAKYQAGRFLQSQNTSSNPYYTKGSGLGKGSNPLFGPGLLTTSAPNASDYAGTKQVQLAHNNLQALSTVPLSPTQGAAPPGNYKGYVNPVPGFTLGRTDQGVDGSAAAGSPIKALGDSQLVKVDPSWYQGQPLLLFKLLNGPAKGQYWYVSEQINPATTNVGTIFHAGDTVAKFANQGTGIEIGWGSPTAPGSTLAQQQGNTGGPGHSNAPAGQNFRAFLNSLGAK